MNNIWSTHIQGPKTLWHSRALRFSDMYKEQYMRAFALDDGAKILEIGCGPGALCSSLKRWYPEAEVIGLDPDSGFIEFAKSSVPNAEFIEGYADALPFSDGSLDATISNTVAEHVEPSEFFGEQYRVLKEGGVCLVLSTRHSISHTAPCIAEESAREKELWQKLSESAKENDEKFKVCGYPMTEQEYPAAMKKYGFRNITVDYVTVNLTPDDPRNSRETAIEMINAERVNELEAVVTHGALSEADEKELISLINGRYDRRIELYDAGEKQWDANIVTIMVMRGVK